MTFAQFLSALKNAYDIISVDAAYADEYKVCDLLDKVARVWNVGLDKAKETLHVTTQKSIRYALHPIHRRYRVDHLLHLGLQARQIVKQFYLDHMQSKVKSLAQNTGAFVFTTGNFSKVYPVTSTAQAGEVLAEFVRDVGVPTDIRTDLASYFTGRDTDFM
jgi:hypothetical protein